MGSVSDLRAQGFRFVAKAPDGREYATTTLAEAKAVEAGRGVPGKGKRRNPVMPMSDRELDRPLQQYSDPRQKWFREIVQNSADAKATEIKFSTNGGSLVAVDNGAGMDSEILLNKFIALGQSSKGEHDIGGFGEAKKLILWPWGRWAVSTRKGSKLLTLLGKGNEWDLYVNGKGPVDVRYEFRNGEPVSILNEAGSLPKTYGTPDLRDVTTPTASGTVVQVWGDRNTLPSRADCFAMLGQCTLPKIKVTFDGAAVPMTFNPVVAGKRAKKLDTWNSSIQGYVYPVGDAEYDSRGVCLVRAGGLLMFRKPFGYGTMVLEITGNTKQILNALRDDFKHSWSFESWKNDLEARLAQDGQRAFRKAKDATFAKGFQSTQGAAKASRERDRLVDTVWDEVAKADKALEKAQKAEAEGARKAEQAKAAEEAAKAAEAAAEEIRRQMEVQAARKQAEAEERARGGYGGGAGDELPDPTLESTLAGTPTGTIAEILKQKGDTRAKVELITWAPPLYWLNEVEDWKVPPAWMPKGLNTRRRTLLQVWTVILKRILGYLGGYDHQFAVGFMFSEEALAATGTNYEELQDLRFYVLNPFVHSGEIREGEAPVSSVSRAFGELMGIHPGKAGTVELDPSKQGHVRILVARAMHELVHGFYGQEGHNKNFAAVQTSLHATLGDQISKIIAAGIEAATGRPSGDKAPGPSEAKIGGAVLTESGRKAPVKVARDDKGWDPRLPPVKAQLRKPFTRRGSYSTDYATVTIGKAADGSPEFYVHRGDLSTRGVYRSLSAAVKAQIGTQINGFAFYDLKDPSTIPPSRYPTWRGPAASAKVAWEEDGDMWWLGSFLSSVEYAAIQDDARGYGPKG